MDPLDLVRFVKHSSVCFEHEDVVIYVDPYHVAEAAHDADLVIITHPDHYSPKEIEKIRKSDTCFATTRAVAEMLRKTFEIDKAYLSHLSCETPTMFFECGAIVTPVVAQNKTHSVDEGFGLVLAFGGFRYYLSGDTDVLADDVPCDVAFVACDGIWNMPNFTTRVPEQLRAMDVLPKLVVPYHYGAECPQDTSENGRILCDILTELGIPCKEWDV